MMEARQQADKFFPARRLACQIAIVVWNPANENFFSGHIGKIHSFLLDDLIENDEFVGQ